MTALTSALRPWLPLLVLALSLPAAATAQGPLAIKGGRIIPVVGDPIDDGVILIRDGTIQAIGTESDLDIPIDARVIDASGKVVLPGFVEPHSSAPLSQSNEVNPNVPFVSVVDAIDPSSDYFENARRNGVTSVGVVPGNNTMIGGQAAVVKTAGMYVDDMILKRHAGLKLSLRPSSGRSRMSHLARLRRELDETKRYIEQREKEEATQDDEDQEEENQDENENRDDSETDEDDPSEPDIQREAMVRLLQGELPAFIYCEAALDVPHALDLIDTYDLDAILVLGRDCDKAAGLVAESGLPVILDPELVFWRTDPRTQEDEQIVLPRLYREANVPITFQVEDSPLTLGRNFYWFQAATAVKYGMPFEEALEALTLRPARLLGIDSFVGSIEEGKDADLIILSGPPLQLDTWVDTTIIDGDLVYRRDEDPRLRELLRPTED